MLSKEETESLIFAKIMFYYSLTKTTTVVETSNWVILVLSWKTQTSQGPVRIFVVKP